LEIEFHQTGVYQYYDVPKAVLEEMLTQPSLGAYFNANIRDVYPCARVR
jgi:KTSC domain